MQMWTRTLLILTLSLTCWSTRAQKQADLPRVLIIGDSVYSNHARPVGAALKGKASVVIAAAPKDTVLNSLTAIEHLDHLLGRIDRNGKPVPEDNWPTWDLIHINVGLGDLIHRVPDMKSFRVLPIHAGGVVAIEPKQYEKNLDVLIGKLKATGAKVVWASTTPIRYSRSNVFKLGSEIEYNKIADRVMKKHGVTTNDMYAYAKSIMNMDKPAGHGADPFHFDKKPIHAAIVQTIVDALNMK
jgi:hypothetical protein